MDGGGERAGGDGERRRSPSIERTEASLSRHAEAGVVERAVNEGDVTELAASRLETRQVASPELHACALCSRRAPARTGRSRPGRSRQGGWASSTCRSAGHSRSGTRSRRRATRPGPRDLSRDSVSSAYFRLAMLHAVRLPSLRLDTASASQSPPMPTRRSAWFATADRSRSRARVRRRQVPLELVTRGHTSSCGASVTGSVTGSSTICCHRARRASFSYVKTVSQPNMRPVAR